RIDLVQGVVGVVVQVEIVGAVLRQPGPGQALGGERADVRSGAALAGRVLDAQRRKRLRDLLGGLARVRGRAGVERVDAAGAEVAFGGDLVAGDVGQVLFRICLAAVQALFLVGEGDDADGPLRRLRQPAD